MIHDEKLFDILLINHNDAIINIFKVLTKKFKLTMKIAKNTQEFVNYSKIYDFHFILCDLHLDYKFEGFFIARLFSTIKKIRNFESEILLLSAEVLSKNELEKFSFDGALPKDFAEIYKFLLAHFQFKTYQEEFEIIDQQKAYYVSV